MATRDDICCIPTCSTIRRAGFRYPLCDHHALGVYREFQDVVDAVVQGRYAMPEGAAGRQPERQGYVYVARVGDLIKIGFSHTPQKRVVDLRGTMVNYEPGTRTDEKALHHRFGPHWEHGEYFRDEGALADYVKAVDGQHRRRK